MPARLPDRAGGTHFRPGLAPPIHSSWPGRGRQVKARGAPVSTPGALALVSARLEPGNGASGPAARGSKEQPPALREVAPAAARVSRHQTAPDPRRSTPAAPRPRPIPSGATQPPEAPPGRSPQAGVLSPRAPIQSRPPLPRPASAAFRLSPPPAPARTPAGQRHPAASRNLTPSSASCAPPRPTANFSLPNFGARGPARRPGGEGDTSRSGAAAGPPDGEGPGSTPRGALGRRPCTGFGRELATGARPDPEGQRPRRRRAALPGEGPPRRRVTCGAARPGSDGPARAPSPIPLQQGPAKFLTCSRRRGRKSERAGAAVAAAEPREGSRPSLLREAAPEQLQTPRP